MTQFVPSNKAEVKALLKLLDSADYAAHRASTAKTAAYKTACKKLRAQHRALFKNPKIAAEHSNGNGCAWEKYGLNDACALVANTFGMPIWDVVGAANSEL